MKNRNLLIVLLILIVSVSVYFTFFRNNRFDESNIEPQLTDTSEISAFVIISNNQKVELSRKTGQWMVNGSFHANETLVKRLLRLFKNLDIKILVPEEDVDELVAELMNSGTKLSFFVNDDEINSYWIGEFTPEQKATLVLNPNMVPAYVTAPGLSEDLKQFVECDPIFWRDKRIFDVEPKDIRKIEYLDYVNHESSFTILANKSEFQLLNSKAVASDFVADNIARYLSYFKNIRFDSLVTELSAKHVEAIIQQQQLAEIKLTNTNGESFSLKLFQKSIDNDLKQPDLNQAYGMINNEKPLVIISYFSVDPLLKSISYFREK